MHTHELKTFLTYFWWITVNYYMLSIVRSHLQIMVTLIITSQLATLFTTLLTHHLRTKGSVTNTVSTANYQMSAQTSPTYDCSTAAYKCLYGYKSKLFG